MCSRRHRRGSSTQAKWQPRYQSALMASEEAPRGPVHLYPTPSVGAHSEARVAGVPCRDFDHDARARSRVSDMAVHGFAAARASAIVAASRARARVPNASGRPVVQRAAIATRAGARRVVGASAGAFATRTMSSRRVVALAAADADDGAGDAEGARARVPRRRHPTRPGRRRCPPSPRPRRLLLRTLRR